MGAVFLDYADYGGQAGCEAFKERDEYIYAFARLLIFFLFTKGKCFIKRNAEDDVGRFQLGAGGAKKLIHLIWQPGGPVLTYRTRLLACALNAPYPQESPHRFDRISQLARLGVPCKPNGLPLYFRTTSEERAPCYLLNRSTNTFNAKRSLPTLKPAGTKRTPTSSIGRRLRRS